MIGIFRMLTTEVGSRESSEAARSSSRQWLRKLFVLKGKPSTIHAATAGVLCALLGGCATVPSINVLGAYFPDWMFCIVGAIVVASFLQSLLRARGIVGRPGGMAAPLAYFALTVILALIGWLAFFNH